MLIDPVQYTMEFIEKNVAYISVLNSLSDSENKKAAIKLIEEEINARLDYLLVILATKKRGKIN